MFGRLKSLALGSIRYHNTAVASSDTVLLNFERNNTVARIILNNPKVHNALSEEVIDSLHDKLDQVKNSSSRCLILSSNGKNFSAGANLNYMKRQGSFTTEENVNDALHLSNLFTKIHEIPIPSIAVVKGASFGGALGLISACDIGICLKNSSFCFSEVKLGLIPATIAPFVVNRIGAPNAKKLFLTAELFNSTVAERIGLIQDIVETEDELVSKETELINLILSNSPNALFNVKKLLNIVGSSDITNIQTRQKTAEMLADIRSSAEAKEGLTAFFEKRKPSYNQS